MKFTFWPGLGTEKGKGFAGCDAPGVPAISANGLAKLGLPPNPAAPTLLSENGGSFELTCAPSPCTRFQYTPNPPRTTKARCPAGPDRAPKPPFGDQANPARGAK